MADQAEDTALPVARWPIPRGPTRHPEEAADGVGYARPTGPVSDGRLGPGYRSASVAAGLHTGT
ncbi:hypothetical protein [Saliphagus sp. LR7]|uniref:hypothetical protein n=1 Tax=Saliphagus sp. LR7 TaxID=2282654 RepID=UPI000DF79D64|nr:hypothetical protein [Saliphagus sp. LR7]